MSSAKDIVIRPISSADGNRIIDAGHYSGTHTRNSQLHLGVFLAGSLLGAMQYGPPMDRRRMLGLVEGATWESVVELNRLFLSELLPRNSESRALAISFRLLRKHAPQVKWVVSFADAAQCGDGTIYRAAGFLLTQINQNKTIFMGPGGDSISDIAMKAGAGLRPEARQLGEAAKHEYIAAGYRLIPGYQMRYVYFLDPSWRSRLTVPVIPFAAIPAECRMYRGKRAGSSEPSGVQPGEDGATPIPALHSLLAKE